MLFACARIANRRLILARIESLSSAKRFLRNRAKENYRSKNLWGWRQCYFHRRGQRK